MKRSVYFLPVLAGLGLAMWTGRGAADVMPDKPAVSPLVEISKTCPGLRYLGRDAVSEITVVNKGSGPAINVVVTDTLPSNATFVSADNGGQRQGGSVVWNLGTLDAGKSAVMHVTVRCTQMGTIRNLARVTYCAAAEAVCETVVKGIPAILLECEDNPDPVEINTQTTYTITATNQGTQTGTNIVIECTLPPEQEFVEAAGATKATVSGKTIRFAPVPAVAAKGRAVFKVTVRGIKAGDSRFEVNMTSDQLTSPVRETESTNIYE